PEISYFHSPLGILRITGSEIGIQSVNFTDESFITSFSSSNIFIEDCIAQLEEYFFGRRKVFSLSLDLIGTDFRKKIWNELLRVPFGKTISYSDLAIKYGDIKAIRAVGMANAKNPVAIIVPCHRVIGMKGDLTGY